MKEELLMLKTIERHLKKKIIPFWTKFLDHEYDGFYGSIDTPTLQIKKHAPKGLVQQARMLWSFSAMQNHLKPKNYLPYMTSAYRYLMNSLKDTQNAGFYWLSDYKGHPLDQRKITYGQGFVIYGLSEYYKATKNQEALEEALALYQLIENKAKNSETLAYWEEFDSNWNKTECLILGDGVLHTAYTLNTTLHLLEAYMNLYDASHSEMVRQSVISLMEFFKNNLYDELGKTLHAYLDEFLQPIGNMISFGHNIEAAWLLDEACEIIDYHDVEIEKMTSSLVEQVYHDGFYCRYVQNHRINESRDASIIWWVQSEAMIGFYNHYQKTQDYKYLHACEKIWETINSCLVDSRENGEWFWSCDENSQPNYERGEAELWKTPYHNSRAMMELIERMTLHAHTSEVFRTSESTQSINQSKK